MKRVTPLLREWKKSRPYLFQSISDSPESAALVAYTSQKAGTTVYVFEINLPILDTIRGNSFESWAVAKIEPERLPNIPKSP